MKSNFIGILLLMFVMALLCALPTICKAEDKIKNEYYLTKCIEQTFPYYYWRNIFICESNKSICYINNTPHNRVYGISCIKKGDK